MLGIDLLKFMNKCWANSLGDCDNKISGEHLISNSILESPVTIVGFPWCEDTPMTIGSSSLKSNFLCKNHNSELSPCDAEILKFKTFNNEFNRKIDIYNKYGFQKKKCPIVYPVNGYLLEKWFCKTLINVSILDKDNPIDNISEIAQYIFKDKTFSEPSGLYAAFKKNQLIRHSSKAEILLSPLYHKLNSEKVELIGGLFTFQGLYFVLLVPSSTNPIRDGKLKLKLNNPDLVGDWNNLDLIWHHQSYVQTKIIGKKTYELQKLNIQWK